MMRYLFAALLVVGTLATDFKTCSDNRPSPVSVEVDGCSSLPCTLTRGTNLTSQVTFIAEGGATTLKPKLLVTLAGFEVQIPLDGNACNGLISGACPLQIGAQAVYELVMPIRQEFPESTMLIEFSLLDQDDVTLACLLLEGQVLA